MVNPYLEVNRIANQRRRDADQHVERDDFSGRSRFSSRGGFSLPRGEPAETGKKLATLSGKPFRSAADFIDSRTRSERDDLEHNVVDFGKWFFFCQHCRHGGHANCIGLWFGGSGHVDDPRDGDSLKRVVCGVNGCTCRCILRQ